MLSAYDFRISLPQFCFQLLKGTCAEGRAIFTHCLHCYCSQTMADTCSTRGEWEANWTATMQHHLQKWSAQALLIPTQLTGHFHPNSFGWAMWTQFFLPSVWNCKACLWKLKLMEDYESTGKMHTALAFIMHIAQQSCTNHKLHWML